MSSLHHLSTKDACIVPCGLLDETDMLARSPAIVRQLKAGETLYIEGDAAPQCFQVITGVLKEYNMLEDGRRQVVDFYTEGEIFGLSGSPHHLYTAEAITDCTIRCYNRNFYIDAIVNSSALARQFIDTMMNRLRQTRERLTMLGKMTAMGRISLFLLRLSSEQQKKTDIRFFMSRQDLGDHLGLTIETVCRTLTELKKKGIIVSTSARAFSIVDEDALEGIAHGEA